MLNNVPTAINNLSRNVVINHPNSYNCVMVRKRVTRTGGSEIGGLPTLGGLAVISNEDEESIEYDLLGNAYALEAEVFTPALMMDRQDANNGGIAEYRYLIEPENLIGVPGGFEVKKQDVMYLVLSPSIRLAYEIVGIETVGNIPPFTQRYICNLRDDLHLVI
jgi:hypothetical protein